ncbi:hypothetical protein Kpho02_67960 [Kitasatospora phosalacinea]|uniref:Uncharacterized protein n=1 Tax=Kitasatospora phosalacinea TaxID=2065 RepID=A0A9W6QGP2_9ACTN|nr:RNA polymerase sigma factor [Kitasatospora phosalacinea]GLW74498.1 hypothetical protein Kpho02_67960 [Kitasatospora phosalacinea]
MERLGGSHGGRRLVAGEADGLICSLVPEIRRQARRYALQSDVEDIVQMVCEKLLVRRSRLEEHPNPLAYALRTVVTTAYDIRSSREVSVPDLTDLAGAARSDTVLLESWWETARLLALLSSGQARMVFLVDLQGWTIDQAAAFLGIHRGTVSQLRARGLRRLQQKIREKSCSPVIREGCESS